MIQQNAFQQDMFYEAYQDFTFVKYICAYSLSNIFSFLCLSIDWIVMMSLAAIQSLYFVLYLLFSSFELFLT